MIDKKGKGNSSQWLLVANNTVNAAAYLKMHTKLTQLAFAKVKELEWAKDIASECLIHCWQHIVANTATVSIRYITIELNRLCCLYLRDKRTLSVVEEAYYSEWSSPRSIWQKFRIADRMEISRFFSILDGEEKFVIQLIIFEEMDIPQIAERIRKPLATVKLLRDRAIYQLKKHFNPEDLPMHQVSAFISLFFGIALAT